MPLFGRSQSRPLFRKLKFLNYIFLTTEKNVKCYFFLNDYGCTDIQYAESSRIWQDGYPDKYAARSFFILEPETSTAGKSICAVFLWRTKHDHVESVNICFSLKIYCYTVVERKKYGKVPDYNGFAVSGVWISQISGLISIRSIP